MNSKKINFINFLRGYSVLLVFLFHLGILEGGFLGVDFFFVISGFLIFKVFKEKYLHIKFGYFKFIVSRIKRLVPALYFCIFVTSILFISILSPNELRDFGQSIIASSFFFSNFLFLIESGYYLPISELKPLLHTWSLSVEFQFYVFITLFFLIFKRKEFLIYIIFFFSLFFSEYKDLSYLNIIFKSFDFSVFDYYLILSRTWEFCLGIIIFKILDYNKKKIKISNFFINFILFTNLIIVFYFNQHINHPGFFTLLPLVSFSFLFYALFFNQDNFIINNCIINYLGKISYSFYLYHFIFISLFKNINYSDIHLKDSILIFFLTLLFSSFSYHFIEKKYYFNILINKKKLISFIFSLIFLNSSFLFFTFNSSNFNFSFLKSYKISEIKKKFSYLDFDKDFFQTELEEFNKKALNDLEFDLQLIYNHGKQGKKVILVLGDSHSRDLFQALKLSENINKEFFIFHRVYNCKNSREYCDFEILNNTIINDKIFEFADYIFISLMYRNEILNHKTLSYLKNFFEEKNSKKLFFSTMSPVFYVGNLDIVTLFFLKYGIKKLDADTVNNISSFAYKSLKPDVKQKNSIISDLTKSLKISLLDRYKLLCDDEKKKCDIFTDPKNKQSVINQKNLRRIFYDHSHLTIDGSRHLSEKIDIKGLLK